MTELRLLDLFSGFGMFSLGLERSGAFRTVAFCEIEDYPRRVLDKHWPRVPIFDDIRELRAEQVGYVDAICGGFPCQDISLAGKGAGIDGERSGLWGEYARLICELRPQFVIVENVAALLVRGLGRVLGDLAALGYDAWWDCVPASAVGAPHRRDRLWLVAYLPDAGDRGQRGIFQPLRQPRCGAASDARRDGEVQPMADADSKRSEHKIAVLGSAGAGEWEMPSRCGPPLADAARLQPGWQEQRAERQRIGAGGQSIADADPDRLDGEPRGSGRVGRLCEGAPGLSGGWRAFDADAFRDRLERKLQGWATARATDGPRDGCDPGWWQFEPDVGRVANGVAARVERLSGLGNGLVPTIPYLIGQAIGESLQ